LTVDIPCYLSDKQFTGKEGIGKTALVQEIVKEFRNIGIDCLKRATAALDNNIRPPLTNDHATKDPTLSTRDLTVASMIYAPSKFEVTSPDSVAYYAFHVIMEQIIKQMLSIDNFEEDIWLVQQMVNGQMCIVLKIALTSNWRFSHLSRSLKNRF